MPKESPCLKVSKNEGQKALTLANKLYLTDKQLGIQRTVDKLFIPLTRERYQSVRRIAQGILRNACTFCTNGTVQARLGRVGTRAIQVS